MMTESISENYGKKIDQYFADLYNARGDSGTVVNFISYLTGMPHLSARGAGFCRMPIIAEDIRDVMKACTIEVSRTGWSALQALF